MFGGLVREGAISFSQDIIHSWNFPSLIEEILFLNHSFVFNHMGVWREIGGGNLSKWLENMGFGKTTLCFIYSQLRKQALQFNLYLVHFVELFFS